MKSRLLFLLLAIFLPRLVSAQVMAANYGYQALSGTYTAITGGTTASSIMCDDCTQSGIPIGFTFVFCGTNYTQLTAGSNGWLSLQGTTSTLVTPFQTSIPGNGFLMPFWTDLHGGYSGAIAKYITTGTAPNRIFTFEWKDWYQFSYSSSVKLSMQVKLYESTNVIQFVYSPVTNNTNGYGTIGIANSTADWQTLNNSTSTASSSSTTFTNNIGNNPALGQIYQYTPPAPCTGAPTIDSITPGSPISVCMGATQLLTAHLPPATGVNYQWYSAASCAGPWTSIGGAILNSYTTPPITGNAYYHLVATCTNTNQSTTSSCVQITPPALFPAGTYTINSAQPTAGTNFNSIGDAVAAIQCGIAGPVVFNAVPGSGPYNEQVYIKEVYNASATNTITFNGNGETVTTTSTLPNYYGYVTLDGADFITFKRWNIPVTTANGFGVSLVGDANHNVIDSNVITMDSNSTSTYHLGIVLSGSGQYYSTYGACDSNTISNNYINGAGYFGIVQYGNYSQYTSGNIFFGNIVKNFYIYGMYSIYCNNVIFEKNDVSRPTRANPTTFYGIYAYYAGGNSKISKNKVHDPSGGDTTSTISAYAIRAYYTSSSAASPVEITNNAIYNFKTLGYVYGIYTYYTTNAFVAYNTIALNHNSGSYTTYGCYNYNSATTYKNNIIDVSVNSYGTVYGIYNGLGTITSDYNDFYRYPNLSTSYVGYSGGLYATLAAWQGGTSLDANSKDLNPYYDEDFPNDRYPTNDTLNDMCLPIAGITTDIKDKVRKPTTPDVGAYEFSRRCDGPADPGTVLVSDTGMCSGYEIVLWDTTYQKDIARVDRQWQQSFTNGNTWYDIANAKNKDSIHLVFPHSTMYYRLRSVCTITSDTTYSNMVKVTLKPQYKCYCYSISEGGATDTSDIGSFSIANFSTNVGGPHVLNPVANARRSDYTDYGPIILYKDSTYAVNVYHTLKSATHANALVTMFIDYNNNNVYDYQTNEAVSLSQGGTWVTNSPNGWYLTNTFTVPHAVITNAPTGLRLVLNNDTNPGNTPSATACGEYVSGETEDYVVIFKENFPTSVKTIAGMQDFVVYPNPTDGLFTVRFDAKTQLSDVQITVTDMTGRVIRSNSYGSVNGLFTKPVDLKAEAKGVYFVELKANDQKIVEKVIVK